MGIGSTVIVQDPVDPDDLFAAARTVVGLPADAEQVRLEYDEYHMLRTGTDQGAAAMVTVLFAPGGRPYPGEEEIGVPDGYAQVLFSTTGTVREASRVTHQHLVAGIGEWLTERNLSWSWQFEGEPWTAGHFRRPGQR